MHGLSLFEPGSQALSLPGLFTKTPRAGLGLRVERNAFVNLRNPNPCGPQTPNPKPKSSKKQDPPSPTPKPHNVVSGLLTPPSNLESGIVWGVFWN